MVLICADLVLATNDHWTTVVAGVGLWGVHMGMTQGLLATMVADTAPADLRGTAYGIFNLTSGVAMLIASAVAGLLWDQFGASFTFHAGALFCVVALLGLLKRTWPQRTGHPCPPASLRTNPHASERAPVLPLGHPTKRKDHLAWRLRLVRDGADAKPRTASDTNCDSAAPPGHARP